MITLKKAIEILDLNIHEAHKNIPPDVLDALKLMVEAGKCLQHGRLIGQHFDPELLPGETLVLTGKSDRPLFT